MVGAALDAGINLFDTADVYGGTKSEEFLGRALGTRRDEAVIATKFGAPIDDDHKGASAAYIASAVEDSLRRLGTDRIDLYQLHMPDASVPIDETLGALDALVRAGKVREIGASNFSPEMIDEAEAVSSEHGWARFVSVQNEYSLLRRAPEFGVLDACERNHIGFLPYFPLASGMLTGKYKRDQAAPEGTRLANAPEGTARRRLQREEFQPRRSARSVDRSARSLTAGARGLVVARPSERGQRDRRRNQPRADPRERRGGGLVAHRRGPGRDRRVARTARRPDSESLTRKN